MSKNTNSNIASEYQDPSLIGLINLNKILQLKNEIEFLNHRKVVNQHRIEKNTTRIKKIRECDTKSYLKRQIENYERCIRSYDSKIEKNKSNINKLENPTLEVKAKETLSPAAEKIKLNAERIKVLEARIAEIEANKQKAIEALRESELFLKANRFTTEIYVLDTLHDSISKYESLDSFSEFYGIPVHKIENALANKSSLEKRYFASLDNQFTFNTTIKQPVCREKYEDTSGLDVYELKNKISKKPGLSQYDNQFYSE